MKIRRIILGACLLGAVLAMLAPPAGAHNEATAAPPHRVLGEISFPTSTVVSEAQDAFIQGVLLLHLFEYPYAREQFQRAEQLDPDMAMAYWGEAMTYNHPIWDEQDLVAARTVLLKLGQTPEERVARAPTPREQGFLASLESLYGPGTKAQRDQAYMRAMEQFAAAYPEDHEVQLFYALSLFGVEAGVRDIPTYMLCTAIAQGVFSENPRHPGAAHYLIHGVDDPVHAVLGLRAARALAEMAPDAGHAQHMTSHIFMAVGMWADVVKANETAIRVQNAMRVEHGETARHWGHYNYWLLYGYLQQGREADALALLTSAYSELQAHDKLPEGRLNLDPDRDITGSVVQMWSRYLIETRDWDSAVANWTFKTGEAFDPKLNITFVDALRGADTGQAEQVEQHRGEFETLSGELRRDIEGQDEPAPGDLQYLERLRVMDRELGALLDQARGDLPAAVDDAGEASRMEGEMPYAFGPPFVDLPSAELLGELLAESRDYAGAVDAFKLQLRRSRLKARALEGLADALEASGQETEANYQRARLAQIRKPGAEAAAAAESQP